MIDLFLIRHGLAGERGTYAVDEDRPLTEEGIRKTRQVAKRLKELGIRFDWVLSSPLVRAKQTAELLLSTGLSDRLEFSETLAPDGCLEDWCQWFQTWQGESLALVGHQPNLGQWAEQLTWGESKDVLILKKAGIIGLKAPLPSELIQSKDWRGLCQLFWLTAPKLFL